MAKRIPGGLFIVVEGIDGAGKTTLVRGLAKLLVQELHFDPVQSKEPTQGRYGAELRATAATQRMSPEQELALLVADRREHVEDLINPALEAGRVVILDRYFYSNLAYQGAEGLALDLILGANAFAPHPQRVLLLDVPAEIGLARIAARGDNPNSFETIANLRAVRKVFREVLPPSPVGHVIDATASEDEVLNIAFQHVIAAIADRVHADSGVSAESVERLRHLIYDPA